MGGNCLPVPADMAAKVQVLCTSSARPLMSWRRAFVSTWFKLASGPGAVIAHCAVCSAGRTHGGSGRVSVRRAEAAGPARTSLAQQFIVRG